MKNHFIFVAGRIMGMLFATEQRIRDRFDGLFQNGSPSLKSIFDVPDPKVLVHANEVEIFELFDSFSKLLLNAYYLEWSLIVGFKLRSYRRIHQVPHGLLDVKPEDFPKTIQELAQLVDGHDFIDFDPARVRKCATLSK